MAKATVTVIVIHNYDNYDNYDDDDNLYVAKNVSLPLNLSVSLSLTRRMLLMLSWSQNILLLASD